MGKHIVTAQQMRACDDYTIQTEKIPSQVLMERAAGAVVDVLCQRDDLFPAGRVLLLCGGGNNGGDGFAAARFLADGSRGHRREAVVLYVGRWNTERTAPDTTAMSRECVRQYTLFSESGGTLLRPDDIAAALRASAVVVDAMVGIGLSSPVRGVLPEVIEAVVRSGLPVLALDIPTGIHSDSGRIMGHALPARATVTMQALKAGLLLYPGADFCGDITVADIGVNLSPADKPYAALADRAFLREVVPPRARRSHKGTYGRVLAVCGSVGMSGAAMLCASAALRAGAGLVEVLTPEENRLVLQTSLPEAIVTTYDTAPVAIGAADAGQSLRRAALRQTIRAAVARASVVVAGCGLGQSETARFVLRTVLESMPHDRRVPLLLDADALNLLSEDALLWETPALSSSHRAVVLTPHPAEMARLCTSAEGASLSVPMILEDVFGAAASLAARRGVTVVLKDAHTVIVSPDGRRFLCPYGNAGMATGGTGDALAGIIAALLGQTSRFPCEVAAAGVALHALAGDAAAEALGEMGMLPSDLIAHIPLITKECAHTTTRIEDI